MNNHERALYRSALGADRFLAQWCARCGHEGTAWADGEGGVVIRCPPLPAGARPVAARGARFAPGIGRLPGDDGRERPRAAVAGEPRPHGRLRRVLPLRPMRQLDPPGPRPVLDSPGGIEQPALLQAVPRRAVGAGKRVTVPEPRSVADTV